MTGFTKTHAKRLLNVAKALRESKAPKAFNMDFWAYSEGDTNKGKAFDCGTPACALGHYAARRDLQREFKIKIDEYFGDVYLDAKTGGENDIFVAAAEHFGLDPTGDREAGELFSPEGCGGAKTAKQAALYIERFVARKLKEQAKGKRS